MTCPRCGLPLRPARDLIEAGDCLVHGPQFIPVMTVEQAAAEVRRKAAKRKEEARA